MDRKHNIKYYSCFGKYEDNRTYYCRKGQVMSGYTIGILLIDVWYPLLPGNVANANTFDFPVRHKLIPGAAQERVVNNDKNLLDDIVKASKELEMEGVRAICGACGYHGNFQNQLAKILDTPVFLSSLLQIPLIRAGLKSKQKKRVM